MRLGISAVTHFFLSIWLMAPQPSVAQTYVQERDAAITIINDFIATNCQRPPVKGSQTNIGIDAKVEAKLKGLTARLLADVGGEVGTNARRAQWDGVAQSHIAEAMAAGNQCSVEMAKLLLPRLLPPKSKELTQPVREDDDVMQLDVTKKQYGVRSRYEKFVIWWEGLSATSEACLSKLSGVGGECRQLPQHMFCSYDYYPGFPLRPWCYWTANDCENHFEYSRKLAQKLDLHYGRTRPPSYRIGCERVPSSRALTQWETLRSECAKPFEPPEGLGRLMRMHRPVCTIPGDGPRVKFPGETEDNR